MSDEIIGKIGNAIEPTPDEHPGGGVSMTKQSDLQASDINNIVARHVAANVPIFPNGRARYGDFTTYEDFHTEANRVFEAEEQFFALPYKVRELCDNDVGKFVAMIGDERGLEALLEAGLPEVAVPEDVQAVTPVTEEAGDPQG